MSYNPGTFSSISFACLVTTASRDSAPTIPASFGCTDIIISNTVCVVLLWYLQRDKHNFSTALHNCSYVSVRSFNRNDVLRNIRIRVQAIYLWRIHGTHGIYRLEIVAHLLKYQKRVTLVENETFRKERFRKPHFREGI